MERWNLWLCVALAFALTACGNSREDQLVSLMKCGRAGDVLQDRRLRDAAMDALKQIGAGPKNPSMEAMEIGQIVRDELEPHGNGTRVERVLKTAQEWRDSSSCQKIVGDFDQKVKAAVEAHMRSFAEKSGVESCAAFSRQYQLAFVDFHAKAYSEKLIPHLRETLSGSMGQLKPFQAAAVSAQLDDAHLRRFGSEVQGHCNGSIPLADSIGLTDAVTQAQSATTAQLESDLKDGGAARESAGLPKFMRFRASMIGDRDAAPPLAQCGKLPEVFCMPVVQVAAIRQALDESRACDRDAPSAKSCELDADDRVSRNAAELQLEALRAARASLITYLEDPRKQNPNTESVIASFAEGCKRLAISQGLRDVAYSERVKTVCMPEARRRFESPQRELLGRVDAEIETLEQPGPAAQQSSGVANEACVNQWIAEFRNQNGQESVIRHDVLQEWEEACAAGRNPVRTKS